jgi:hypothetical protein
MDAAAVPMMYEAVSPTGQLYSIEEQYVSKFAGAQRPPIVRVNNFKRACDPAENEHHFAEGWQGKHNVRVLQRVDPATMQPVDPPVHVVVNGEAKDFYMQVVSQRADMEGLHGSQDAAVPWQTLRKLMSGKLTQGRDRTPVTHKDGWRILKPPPNEVDQFLTRQVWHPPGAQATAVGAEPAAQPTVRPAARMACM